LRKKLEGMKFNNIYESGVRASKYKSLLREEVEKNVPIYGTYYQETVDVDVVEFINGELLIYDALTKKNGKVVRSLRSNEERHYSFDINQTDDIFDWLLANKICNFKFDSKVHFFYNLVPVNEREERKLLSSDWRERKFQL
jgi:hypothetical protein